MSSVLKAGLLATACSLVLLPNVAQAQGACPEGRTANGQCVNPLLASAMTQSAMIYSQPKISQTHYPILPALDWIYRYPHQLIPNQLTPSAVGTPVTLAPPSSP